MSRTIEFSPPLTLAHFGSVPRRGGDVSVEITDKTGSGRAVTLSMFKASGECRYQLVLTEMQLDALLELLAQAKASGLL